MRFFFAALVAVIFVSCSGSGNTTGGGGGSATGGSGMGGSGTGGSMASGGGSSGTGGGGTSMAMIPDPGTGDAVDQDWTNVEPNDTPAQATPLGVAMGDIWTWVSSNNAGGSDTSDYFVFKSAPDGGTLHFDVCFGAPITSMTANLWKVSGGVQVQPAVATWNSTGGCVTDTGAELMLLPSTEYLVGLTIAGDAGTYSA
jgi:hypothetical protein